MIGHPSTKLLDKLAEGQASEAQAVKINAHLERCEKCRKQFELIEAIENRFSGLPSSPADLSERIKSSLPEQVSVSGPLYGEVDQQRGSVVVFRGNEQEGNEVFPGMALHRGDRLRVMGDGLALVKLVDGSSLYINKDSEVALERQDIGLRLFAGAVFAMMKPQRQTFCVTTPSATLSVLGTEFETTVTDHQRTILKVTTGAVEVKTQGGRAVVGKRRKVEVSAHTQPSPVRFSADEGVGAWISPLGSVSQKRRGGVLAYAAAGCALLALIALTSVLYPEKKVIETESLSLQVASNKNEQQQVPKVSRRTRIVNNQVVEEVSPIQQDAREIIQHMLSQRTDTSIFKMNDEIAYVVPADTTGLSAEAIARIFYECLISKDTDLAVGYLNTPTEEAQKQIHLVLRHFLQRVSINKVTQIETNENQPVVHFITTGEIQVGVEPTSESSLPEVERTAILFMVETPTGLKIDAVRSDLFGKRDSNKPEATTQTDSLVDIVQSEIDKGQYKVVEQNVGDTIVYKYSVTLPGGTPMTWVSNTPLHK